MGFWGTLGHGTLRVIKAPVTLPKKAIGAAQEKTMQMIIASVVRHALTTVGGGLIVNGTMGSSDLEAIIGAATTIVGVIWSVIEKRNRSKG